MNDKELKEMEILVRKMLDLIGEDSKRPGLIDTPGRVARAWQEWTRGMSPSPHTLRLFPAEFPGMVVRKGIPFASTCEHHLAHYTGTIDFGYLPKKYVTGISKIIRFVQHYAAKLTIQEALSVELIKKFEEEVKPRGTILKITGYHSCESTRGVNQPNVPTVTFLCSGVFKKDKDLVRDFFELIK